MGQKQAVDNVIMQPDFAAAKANARKTFNTINYYSPLQEKLNEVNSSVKTGLYNAIKPLGHTDEIYAYKESGITPRNTYSDDDLGNRRLMDDPPQYYTNCGYVIHIEYANGKDLAEWKNILHASKDWVNQTLPVMIMVSKYDGNYKQEVEASVGEVTSALGLEKFKAAKYCIVPISSNQSVIDAASRQVKSFFNV